MFYNLPGKFSTAVKAERSVFRDLNIIIIVVIIIISIIINIVVIKSLTTGVVGFKNGFRGKCHATLSLFCTPARCIMYNEVKYTSSVIITLYKAIRITCDI
jgi:uncharacterized membrane protein YraQ (UPF0718 family)